MHAQRIQNQDWSLRTRTEEEIRDLLTKHAEVARYIKSQRTRWNGQILIMYKEGAVKIIIERNQLQYESLVDRG